MAINLFCDWAAQQWFCIWLNWQYRTYQNSGKWNEMMISYGFTSPCLSIEIDIVKGKHIGRQRKDGVDVEGKEEGDGNERVSHW